jgi:hypothetical protein
LTYRKSPSKKSFAASSRDEAGYNLEENLGALAVHLTPGNLKSLNEAAKPGVVAGDRYPAQSMQAVNR